MLRELDLTHSDELEGHIARHGVRLSEIIQVFRDEPRLFRHGHGHLMVGCTRGGRLLTIPATQPSRGRWRPKTAFDAVEEERTKYGKGCGEYVERT